MRKSSGAGDGGVVAPGRPPVGAPLPSSLLALLRAALVSTTLPSSAELSSAGANLDFGRVAEELAAVGVHGSLVWSVAKEAMLLAALPEAWKRLDPRATSASVGVVPAEAVASGPSACAEGLAAEDVDRERRRSGDSVSVSDCLDTTGRSRTTEAAELCGRAAPLCRGAR